MQFLPAIAGGNRARRAPGKSHAAFADAGLSGPALFEHVGFVVAAAAQALE